VSELPCRYCGLTTDRCLSTDEASECSNYLDGLECTFADGDTMCGCRVCKETREAVLKRGL
jgi:hypothetical protein